MYRMSRRAKDVIKLLMIIVGNIMDAAGFVLFVSGSGLITGGTSGIGLFFYRQFGIPTSIFVFIVNAIMLVVGFFLLGKRFALSTIVSTFCYPLAMGIMEHYHPLRARATSSAIRNAPLAQLVEHLTLNQGAQGSSP